MLTVVEQKRVSVTTYDEKVGKMTFTIGDLMVAGVGWAASGWASVCFWTVIWYGLGRLVECIVFMGWLGRLLISVCGPFCFLIGVLVEMTPAPNEEDRNDE